MWSIYDTCILLAGIIMAVLAVVPVKGIAAKTRLLAGLIGGGLVLLSLLLGSLGSLRYPAVVVAAPFIAALVVGGAVYNAVRGMDQPGAMHGELGHSVQRAADGSASASVSDAAVLATPAVAPTLLDAETDPDLRAACDPRTPPEELARLAHTSRRFWPAIAANPAAYEGLLGWLAEHGGAEITSIIGKRSEQ